ncbi:MAG TPA: response regulator transcription factor [Bacillota bacterium]|nr:response regulator transcription factor [Bacillota bacterium]HPQ61564.1 response regulator transcription factor [Bacillota bacterium]
MGSLIYTVEDDINIQYVIKIALQNSGFEVEVFGDAESFYTQMEQKLPDLVSLDIMLPGEDGIGILQKMKNTVMWKNIPVLIVSAKSSEIDKVVGLDLGADDYMIKPFGVLELVSRIKALLRRSKKGGTEKEIEVSGLILFDSERTCTFKGKSVVMTAKEYELLKLLVSNNGQTVTRNEIVETVWGYDFIGESRTVDAHIKTIRQKLASIGLAEAPILTVRGIGYKAIL